MKILIVNDDGIEAEGIIRLAKAAKSFGEVWVIAPGEQCSAMSHRITIRGSLLVKKEAFPVEGVTAYRVGGTPADCVKAALGVLLPWTPDLVLSGINDGYNVGNDIMYSGTVAGAMQAVLNKIPAIAFSNRSGGSYEVAEAKIHEVIENLLKREISTEEIWNVNFPGCELEAYKGIWDGCFIEKLEFVSNIYKLTKHDNGDIELVLDGRRNEGAVSGSDMYAVTHGYTAIGKVRRM